MAAPTTTTMTNVGASVPSSYLPFGLRRFELRGPYHDLHHAVHCQEDLDYVLLSIYPVADADKKQLLITTANNIELVNTRAAQAHYLVYAEWVSNVYDPHSKTRDYPVIYEWDRHPANAIKIPVGNVVEYYGVVHAQELKSQEAGSDNQSVFETASVRLHPARRPSHDQHFRRYM